MCSWCWEWNPRISLMLLGKHYPLSSVPGPVDLFWRKFTSILGHLCQSWVFHSLDWPPCCKIWMWSWPLQASIFWHPVHSKVNVCYFVGVVLLILILISGYTWGHKPVTSLLSLIPALPKSCMRRWKIWLRNVRCPSWNLRMAAGREQLLSLPWPAASGRLGRGRARDHTGLLCFLATSLL